MAISARVAVVLALSMVLRADGQVTPAAQGAAPPIATTSYADVRPIWDVLRPHLPSGLAAVPPANIESAWVAWARAHDREIRSRVARGDEDSLVNLWLFGTSFTSLPPARTRDVAMHGSGATVSEIAERRLDDLLTAIASPGTDERLRWSADFLRARTIDPATSRGRARAREFLLDGWRRMLAENTAYARVLESPNAERDPVASMAPYADLYRDRGLSPDTSILSSFAVDSALEVLTTSRRLHGPIRRVAIVGPGLDFVNKADGHDFYPEQTIQPFALVDSLIRLGLSTAGELSVTTFDVSTRVNQHLAGARARGRAGTPYLLHLPLANAERWSPGLISFWEEAGSRIGQRAAVPAASTGAVKVRAVRVRPDIVAAVTPLDLNIVLERLEPLPDGERFDLVVATNVFIYYDTFQQALAMLNVAGMLRPGGSLLTNQAVRPVPPLQDAVGHDTVVYSDRQFDRVFWYQRQR